MTDTIETDDFDLDFDLDLGIEDGIGGGVNTDIANQNRNVASYAVEGVKDGLESVFTDADNIGTFIENAIPRRFAGQYTDIGNVYAGVSQEITKATDSIKPQVSNLLGSVKQILPEGKLKKYADILQKKVAPPASYARKTEQEEQAEKISEGLSAIFDKENTKSAREKVIQDIQKNIERGETKAMHLQMATLAAKTTENTGNLASYQAKITNGYQRKSLELSYKKYFILKGLLSVTKNYAEAGRIQNEAIIKNTSLPEFQKIKNTERFSADARSNLNQNIIEKLTQEGSFLNKAGNRAKSVIAGRFSMLKDGLDPLQDAADTVVAGKEAMKDAEDAGLDINKYQQGASTTTSIVLGSLIAKIGEKISDRLDKDNSEDKRTKVDDVVTDLQNKVSAGPRNFKRKLDENIKKTNAKEDENGGLNIKDRVVKETSALLRDSLFGNEGSASFERNTLDGRNQASIDSDKNKSIITVIPTLLSKILQQVTSIRTGADADHEVYDMASGRFITQKESTKNVERILQASTDGTRYNRGVDESYDTIVGDNKLSPKASEALKKGISNAGFTGLEGKDSVVGISDFAKESNKSLFDTDDDTYKEIQALIEKRRDNLDGYGRRDIMHVLGNAKKSLPDSSKVISQLIAEGKENELLSLGLVKLEGGRLVLDVDAYKRLITEGTLGSKEEKATEKATKEMHVVISDAIKEKTKPNNKPPVNMEATPELHKLDNVIDSIDEDVLEEVKDDIQDVISLSEKTNKISKKGAKKLRTKLTSKKDKVEDNLAKLRAKVANIKAEDVKKKMTDSVTTAKESLSSVDLSETKAGLETKFMDLHLQDRLSGIKDKVSKRASEFDFAKMRDETLDKVQEARENAELDSKVNSLKEKYNLSGTKDKILNIKRSIKFGKQDESEVVETMVQQEEDQVKLLDKLYTLINERIPESTKKFNDRDGDGTRDNSFTSILKRRKEAKANKFAGSGDRLALNVAKKGGSLAKTGLTSLLGMLVGLIPAVIGGVSGLIGGIGSLGGGIITLTKAILAGKALGVASDLLDNVGGTGSKDKGGKKPKKAPKGKIARLFRAVKAIVPTQLWRKGDKLAGAAVKKGGGKGGSILKRGLGSSVRAGGKLGGFVLKKGAGIALKGGAGIVTTAAGAAIGGTTALASTALGTVALGAVAVKGTVDIGYFGVDYFTRNNATDVEKFRMAQYGFDETMSDYYHVAFNTEKYCQGAVIVKNDRATVNLNALDFKELMDIANVSEENAEIARTYFKWFKHRFIPVFNEHLNAIKIATGKHDLNSVKFLNSKKTKIYLEAAKFPNGPYSIFASPIEEIDILTAGSAYVNNAYLKAIAKVKGDTKTVQRFDAISKAKKQRDELIGSSDKLINNATMFGPSGVVRLALNKIMGKEDSGVNTFKKYFGFGDNEADSPKDGKKPPKDPTPSPGRPSMAGGALLPGTRGRNAIVLKDGNVNIDDLHPIVRSRLLGMAEEYYAITGNKLFVNDGHRSFEEQRKLKAKYGKRAAAPGKSLHNYGLAIDVNSADLNKADKLGLMRKYGFTRPVGGEPWHMEPAGIQESISKAKTDRDFLLNALNKSPGKGGGGYGTLSSARKYGRDRKLAMSLLNASSTTIDPNKGSETSSKSKTININGVTVSADKSPLDSFKSAEPNKINGFMKASFDPTSKSSTLDMVGKAASVVGGVDPDALKILAARESSANPNAKGTGKALGLMQFMPDTFDEEVEKNGGKFGIKKGTSRLDPKASAILGATKFKDNIKSLSKVKKNPTVVDVYLAHLLGTTGARKFLRYLSASPRAVAQRFFKAAARSNPKIFYKDQRALTFQGVYEKVTELLKKDAEQFGINWNLDTDEGLDKAQQRGAKELVKSLSNRGQYLSKVSTVSPRSNKGLMPAPVAKLSRKSKVVESRAMAAKDNTMGKLSTGIDTSVEVQREILNVLKQILDKDPVVVPPAQIIQQPTSAPLKSASRPSKVKQSNKLPSDSFNLSS